VVYKLQQYQQKRQIAKKHPCRNVRESDCAARHLEQFMAAAEAVHRTGNATPPFLCLPPTHLSHKSFPLCYLIPSLSVRVSYTGFLYSLYCLFESCCRLRRPGLPAHSCDAECSCTMCSIYEGVAATSRIEKLLIFIFP
jgi:hypothetical protein